MRVAASTRKLKLRSRAISMFGPTASRNVPIKVRMWSIVTLFMVPSVVPPTAAETAPVNPRGVAGIDDVGLERGESARDHFLAQGLYVVPGPKRRHTDDVGVACARRSAVRPVDALAPPDRPPEQLVYGHAERLRLDIPQGELNPGDGFGSDPAGTLTGHAIKVPVARFDGTRILAQEDCFEFPGGRYDAVGHAPIGAFAVAGDASVGADGDELPRSPTRIDDECIDCRDFHGSLPSTCGPRRTR